MDPVIDGWLVKFHCGQLGRQTRNQADPKNQQRRGKYKRAGTVGGRLGEFMLEETHERRGYKDVTGGRKMGVGVG